MNKPNPQQSFNPFRAVKKLFLSIFVVLSFLAYALHKPASSQANAGLPVTSNPGGAQPSGQQNAPQANQAQPTQPQAIQQQAVQPTATAPAQQVFSPTDTAPAPTATAPAAPQQASSGQYKDGTYNGPEVDAFYGLVQVQVVVKNGKIANVQFLEYPNDRRTSQRINSFAVPTLQQEAMQAQSASVDWISGATLTSQAFQMSLQSALNQAKG
jgi:uncharacterized protein with FMN-binding domain